METSSSAKPRTVDNLGVDVSREYAKRKELLEAKYIEDASFVSSRSEISSLTPYIPSGLEPLFSVGASAQWANFPKWPAEKVQRTASLFSHQMVPSLGEPETLEALQEKLASLSDQKKEVLIRCLNSLVNIDRNLALIDARRSQYHKG